MQGAASEQGPVPARERGGGADLVRVVREDGSVAAEHRGALDHGPELLRQMTRLRSISARMIDLQRGESIGYHASSVGEEGAIVGATLAARPGDWIFPGVREWGAAIVRGMPIAAYVHHAFGTAEDRAKGHSAPDHPPARDLKVAQASGVVGAHLVQAVGCAWAARTKKDDVAAITLFGEGATSTGDFHNAMNFAGVFKAPVVFLCRNNGRATSTPAARQTRSTSFAEKAIAYGIARAQVDGQDALAVHAVVCAAIARAAEGKGPTLIEALTEPGPGDRDPIAMLRRALEREKRVDAAAIDGFAADTDAEIDRAIEAAKRAAPPRLETMFEDVYESRPPHLAAQEREALAWRR